ncbi:hypothetical protein DFH11DRAFT_1741889 [Phellopilus nigrolimitatus]|nr:hypothetical protein DFH11DRAFT_1741889 [Phellopilus nigrolimitatus]
MYACSLTYVTVLGERQLMHERPPGFSAILSPHLSSPAPLPSLGFSIIKCILVKKLLQEQVVLYFSKAKGEVARRLCMVLADSNHKLVQMSGSAPSLDSLVDNGISNDEHKDMDVTTWFVIRKLKIDLKSPSLADLATVIALVVNESPTSRIKLNKLYRNEDDATALLRRNKTIEAMLRKIMSNGNGNGSFKELRQLRILQAPGFSPPKKDDVTAVNTEFLSRAFYDTGYRGTAADLFLNYVLHNDGLFQEHNASGGPRYYGKFLSIVQSSGTGKSRMVHELGKQGKCILVYMNLVKNDRAFPSGDTIPIELLQLSTTKTTSDSEESQTTSDSKESSLLKSLDSKCYTKVQRIEAIYSSFFAAIFDTFASEAAILRSECANKLGEFPRKWYDKFSGRTANGMRKQFFSSMEKFFWKSLEAITKSLDERTLKLQRNTKLEERRTIGHATMLEAYDEARKQFLAVDNLKMPLLIVFDEAAWLANPPEGLEKESIKQSHILCRIISTFSHHHPTPIWCTFISTNSRTGDFSGFARTQTSDRIRLGGELLFRPFTELGLHQLAKPLKDIDLGRVWKYENLVGFGRPLWAAQSAAKTDSLTELIEFGKTKLTRGQLESGTNQWLAVVSQRFCLDLVFAHPQTVAFEEEAVAGYMRYLIATSENRDLLYTVYPTEPVLSQSAAEHLWGPQWPDPPFVTPIRYLTKKINGGMINKGTVGELAARLLLLIAKDICARDLEVGEDEFRYCGSVPLVTWLRRLFGDDIFTGREKLVKEQFGNAVINFSHWVGMSENIAKLPKEKDKGSESEYPDPEWLQRLFVTTAAIQCCHGQPLIDNAIPVWDPVKKRFFYVLIQAKNTVDQNKGALHNISHNAVFGLDEKKPCVIILMDLDASKSKKTPNGVDVALNERGEPHCLRIHAKGCGAQTYKGLKDHPFLSDMEGLLKVSEEPTVEGDLKVMRDRARIFNRRDNAYWE